MRGSVFSYDTAGGKRWGFVHDLPGEERRRVVKKRGFRLRRDADNALRQSIEGYRSGNAVPPSDQTVGQAVAVYIEDRRGDVAPNTAATWLWAQKHIVRALGPVRIEDLRPEHFDAFLRKMQDTGLSQGSRRKAAQTLKLVLARLALRGHLSPRVYAGVRWPKRPKLNHTVLSLQEIAFVLARTKGSRYEVPFLVAVTTGLRRNELLAIHEEDYSPEALQVRAETSKGKTRRIPLRAAAAEALGAIVEENRLARARRPGWNRDGYLFADPISGEPYDGNAWTVAWTGWRQRNLPDMRPINWHALRHTAATHWLRAGVPLPKVSVWLGHTSVQTTATVYAHELEGADDDPFISRVEERFPVAIHGGAIVPFTRRNP